MTTPLLLVGLLGTGALVALAWNLSEWRRVRP